MGYELKDIMHMDYQEKAFENFIEAKQEYRKRYDRQLQEESQRVIRQFVTEQERIDSRYKQ